MSDALLDIAAPSGVMQFTQPEINDDAAPSECVDMSEAEVPATLGAAVNPSVYAEAAIDVVLAGHFLYDYYYRIWVIPETMQAQNPVIGSPIPFHIWNAYPQPANNLITGIVDIGGDGLEFDFGVGDSWKAIEYREVTITITPTAPIDISASFEFEFTEGVGLFFFIASIADFVQMVPDPPVIETWGWLTDVISARDGSEQRIALRSSPRRATKYSFLLEDEAERRRQYNRWFKSLAGRIVLPYYQYSTKITQADTVGATKLWFDPARTDVRDGEFALVYREADRSGYLVKLDTVEADGATTDNPLSFAALTDMIIAPAFTSRLADRTGFSMKQVTGKIDVQALALTARTEFSRPGSAAVIQTYDDLPVLHYRPTAMGETPEVFEANYDVIDSQTGISDVFSAWEHVAVGTVRRWTIRRLQNPGEMDWWRDFLNTILGQREPFLMATWFHDLVLTEEPLPGASQLTIAESDYPSLYWPHDTYKRLQFETTSGPVWRKIVGVTENVDGTATLDLNTPLGATAEEVDISKVSFLNRVRLASDTVTLTHGKIRTDIELSTRTVDS